MPVAANKMLGVVGKAIKKAFVPGEDVLGKGVNAVAAGIAATTTKDLSMAARGGLLKQGALDAGRAIKSYATQGGAKDIAIRAGVVGGAAYLPRLASGSANPFVNSQGETDIIGIPFIQE